MLDSTSILRWPHLMPGDTGLVPAPAPASAPAVLANSLFLAVMAASRVTMRSTGSLLNHSSRLGFTSVLTLSSCPLLTR